VQSRRQDEHRRDGGAEARGYDGYLPSGQQIATFLVKKLSICLFITKKVVLLQPKSDKKKENEASESTERPYYYSTAGMQPEVTRYT
jgi:hypothetical protein